MTPFNMSWVGVCRVFNVAYTSAKLKVGLTAGEINTYKYLFDQCNDDQKGHLVLKYGDLLEFLKLE